MENLCFYLLDGLLECGTIVPCETKVAGEDAWRIEIEVDEHFVRSWCLLRSEICLIRDCYEERKLWMSFCERANVERLLAVL